MYVQLSGVPHMDGLLTEIYNFLNIVGGWNLSLGPADVDLTPNMTDPTGAGGQVLVATNGNVLLSLRSTTLGNGAGMLLRNEGIPPFTTTGSPSYPNGNAGELPPPNLYTAFLSLGIPPGPALGGVGDGGGFGPFPSVHLFTDNPSTQLHIAVELWTGYFTFLLSGNLTKWGRWQGGAYYCTSWWPSTFFRNVADPGYPGHQPDNNYANAPFEEFFGTYGGWKVQYSNSTNGDSNWVNEGLDGFNNDVQYRGGTSSARGGFNRTQVRVPIIDYSQIVPLGPLVVSSMYCANPVGTPPHQDGGSPTNLRYIGMVPNARMVNMKTLAPGEELQYGPKVWKCFPFAAKGDVTGVDNSNRPNSGVGGIAFLKDTT